MIQIAQVPYRKTYKFSYFSDAMFLKAFLYIFSLLIAFFLVYSVNNFYLSYSDNFTGSPSINYDYNYHLVIETSNSAYTYSTLYQSSASRALSFSYQNNQNNRVHTFTFNWPKPVTQKVKKVSLLVFMSYSSNTVTNANGAVLAEGNGYDISDLNVVGTTQIKKGMNILQNPPTSNSTCLAISVMSKYSYNIGITLQALQQNYKTYLQSSTQFLTNNMPNNLLKFSFKIKGPSLSSQEQSGSVLGQLVWTFSQYFPIACVLWFLSTWIFSFMLRENVLKRTVIHDHF